MVAASQRRSIPLSVARLSVSRAGTTTSAPAARRTHGLQADAGVAAGDANGDLAGQVDALDDVLGAGRGVESGVEGLLLLLGGHGSALLDVCLPDHRRTGIRTMNA